MKKLTLKMDRANYGKDDNGDLKVELSCEFEDQKEALTFHQKIVDLLMRANMEQNNVK